MAALTGSTAALYQPMNGSYGPMELLTIEVPEMAAKSQEPLRQTALLTSSELRSVQTNHCIRNGAIS